MKKRFPKTKMFVEAAQQSKGKIWILEILIFLVVFLVTAIVSSLPSLVYGIIGMMNDEHMIDVIMQYNAGDITMEQYQAEVMAFETSGLSMIVQLFSTVLSTILTIIYCRFIEKRKISTMGFRKNTAAVEYLVGMLIGTLMFSLAVGICLLTGALTFGGAAQNISWGLIALFFCGYLLQGMSEEVTFRGFFMVSLARRSNIALAIALSSIAFGCAHLGNPGVNVLPIINICIFGVFEGIYILKRGNIWGACAIHSLWNFIQGNFYGISVSGLGETESVFKMSSVAEKSLINGGSFGLEGGLAVTVVLAISIAALCFTKTKKSEIAEESEKNIESVESPE